MRNGKRLLAFGFVFLVTAMLAPSLTGCGGSVSTEAVAPATSAPGPAAGSDPGPATGAATLAWTAPTTNSDGTQINDLLGFKIYYGTAHAAYGVSIDVGGNTSYQIDNLAAGTTYYFTVTAYNTSGIESDYSLEVSKYIN